MFNNIENVEGYTNCQKKTNTSGDKEAYCNNTEHDFIQIEIKKKIIF